MKPINFALVALSIIAIAICGCTQVTNPVATQTPTTTPTPTLSGEQVAVHHSDGTTTYEPIENYKITVSQGPTTTPNTITAAVTATPKPVSATPVPTANPTVKPTAAPKQSGTSFSGTGNEVTDPFYLKPGMAKFKYKSSGSDLNFIGLLMDSSGKTVAYPINEIGAAEGSSAERVDGGQYVLKVLYPGSWTVDVTQ